MKTNLSPPLWAGLKTQLCKKRKCRRSRTALHRRGGLSRKSDSCLSVGALLEDSHRCMALTTVTSLTVGMCGAINDRCCLYFGAFVGGRVDQSLCASTLASFKLMSLTLIARRGGGQVAHAAGLWRYSSVASMYTVLRTSIEWSRQQGSKTSR